MIPICVWELVDLNTTLLDLIQYLEMHTHIHISIMQSCLKWAELTRFLNWAHSSGVRVSALAITGITFTYTHTHTHTQVSILPQKPNQSILTFSCSSFIKAISISFNLHTHTHTHIRDDWKVARYVKMLKKSSRPHPSHLPMSSGGDEVETTVDASVFQHSTEHSEFFIQILIILGVYVLDDGVPAAWRRERERGVIL